MILIDFLIKSDTILPLFVWDTNYVYRSHTTIAYTDIIVSSNVYCVFTLADLNLYESSVLPFSSH